ncbi:MAG TPA: hypothetical protein VHH92_03375 [Actinomycetota bacterium]|nr:hypothetical protein [Actinomycetota bacterium]
MRELFRIPRVALPAWTKRTLSVAVAGVIVASMVISPGVSMAAKLFTMKKAAKISLGNTVTVTQALATDGSGGTTFFTPTVMCPAGRQALKGGMDSPQNYPGSPNGFVWLTESAPVNSGGRSVGWYMEILDASSASVPFTVYAVCAP